MSACRDSLPTQAEAIEAAGITYGQAVLRGETQEPAAGEQAA